MSVAVSIKERNPELDVCVFERSVVPYGASTRNAGFACFGSLTELLVDITTMGEEAARQLCYARWQGMQVTRKRLGDQAIGFEALGGYELILPKLSAAMDRIEDVNGLLADFLPTYVTPVEGQRAMLGIKSPEQRLVRMNGEGQLHTGKLVQALEAHALKLGVRMRTGVSVQHIEGAGPCAIAIEDPVRGKMEIHARQAVVCTNAFVKRIWPAAELHPGRGQVFITKPIPGLSFRGNLHMDEGYYYLRSVGDRLLFGGARHLDMDTEQTTSFGDNTYLQSHLEQRLAEVLHLPKGFEVEQRWSGIMAFGVDKQPIVKQVDSGLFVAARMGGMGIALAGQIGETVADLIINSGNSNSIV